MAHVIGITSPEAAMRYAPALEFTDENLDAIYEAAGNYLYDWLQYGNPDQIRYAGNLLIMLNDEWIVSFPYKTGEVTALVQ